jgi:GNAT superfamily N-acetyltransferase
MTEIERDPRELAARLEAIEMAAWEDFYRAAPDETARRFGIQAASVGSGVLGMASTTDVLALNRVVGLGVRAPASERHLDRIVRAYREAGAPRFFVQVCPAAEPSDLPAWLESRGLRHYNNWVKLYRGVEPAVEASTDLRIEQIDGSRAAAFAAVCASCFDWPDFVREWVTALVERPGWHHYMAFDGERPAATGAFYARRADAWLDFASTLPEYRGRGAQSALISRRIEDARALGCRCLVVETAQQRPEREAPSYRNTLSFGFRVAYLRPNYLWSAP